MPTVLFTGYAEPRLTHINVSNLTPIWELNVVTGRVAKFTIEVSDCQIQVQCELDEIDEKEIDQLYTRSVELSRALINLIALKMGVGMTVIINKVIKPDGTHELLCSRAAHLIGRIDSYAMEDIDQMFQRFACDVDFTMMINDMVDAMTRPRTVSVNCARAIDSVKNMTVHDGKDRASWGIVREKLKIDEDYVQEISRSSTTSRHGKHSYISVETSEDLLLRTWEVFNRYLHSLKYPNQIVPPDKFAQLKISPKPQS
jgi:hypothetical protein